MTTVSSASAQIMDFESLNGWAQDDHRAALLAFVETCEELTDDWAPIPVPLTPLPAHFSN
jgi:membrane-bound lytic murein transglycosylase A